MTSQIVQLPQVETVRAETVETVVEQDQGAIAVAPMGFTGEKDLVAGLTAQVLEGRAVIILALLIGRCRIEIADAQTQGFFDHWHRALMLSAGPKNPLAAERHRFDHHTGFAKLTGRVVKRTLFTHPCVSFLFARDGVVRNLR